MAGGFLRALAKMKLVEIDEGAAPPAPPETKATPADAEIDLAEVDRILAEEDAKAKEAAKPKAAPRSAPKPTARAAPAPRAAAPPPPPPQPAPELQAAGPGGI